MAIDQTIDAYHLPGLAEADVAEWDHRSFDGGVRLRFPVLRPDRWRQMLLRLGEARATYLADRPVHAIVAAIDEAADRLSSAGYHWRRVAEAALPAVTGYSAPMIRLGLDRMLADWRRQPLETLLSAEFGDPAVLDGFVPRRRGPQGSHGDFTRAFGPKLAFHIFSGNVPGVAVTAIVRSLLVKAATAGKLGSGEPLLPVLFARTLSEVAEGLGACLALTYWPGGSEALEAAAFDAADAVIVYGGEDAAADVRRRAGGHPRLIVYGPRLSCGVVAREALGTPGDQQLMDEIARAVAIFDQQGCVSPHVIYVEQGASVEPRQLAARLADSLARLEIELPRGQISAAEAVAIRNLRTRVEFRGHAGDAVELHAGTGTSFTVIYDPTPEFALSCLNRVVWVKPLDELDDVVDRLRPHAHLLQSVALAASQDRRLRLANQLGEIGASRITSFLQMPWPGRDWHHDGTEPLRGLVRWVDMEEANVASAATGRRREHRTA
jgi:hypothetical protein